MTQNKEVSYESFSILIAQQFYLNELGYRKSMTQNKEVSYESFSILIAQQFYLI